MEPPEGSSPDHPPRRPGIPLERVAERRLLRDALDAAADGRGGLTVVAGPAGIGKTTLLLTATVDADDRLATVAGRGLELEQALPFAVLRQCVEPLVAGLDPARQAQLFRGPAGVIERLVTSEDAAVDAISTVAHGLYWTFERLAAEQPLCVVIDDAQWLDPPSAEALAYVAQRLDGSPIGMIVATRDDDPGAIDWRQLARRQAAVVLSPAPLSRSATHDLALDTLADDGTAPPADPVAGAFVAVCHHLTAGNPRLLVELLAACREAGISPTTEGATRLGRLTPARMADLVVDRIERLGDDATAVARAVAVLESGLPDVVAALAEVDPDESARLIDRLVAADLLADAVPLRFAHPLTASLVLARMRRPALDAAHRRAARLLADRDPERAAAHLLRCEPAGEAWATRTLCAAARTAAGRAAPAAAARLYERAFRETADDTFHAEWGAMLMAAGDPQALPRFERALAVSRDPAERAGIAVLLGQAQFASGQAGGMTSAISTLRRALDDAQRSGQTATIDDVAVAIGLIAVDDTPLRERAIAHARAQSGDPRLDAVSALDGFCRGLPAPEVAAWARSGVTALADTPAGGILPTFHLAVWSLAGCDETDAADVALSAAFEHARATGSRLTYGLACFLRAWVRWRRGDLRGMVADIEQTVIFAESGWAFAEPSARWLQAEAALLRGDARECGAAIEQGLRAAEHAEWHLATSWLRHARSGLLLVQGDAEQALVDALLAGSLLAERMTPGPGIADWRGRAVRAALAVGDREQATAIAAEGLERAQRFGTARTLALAHRSSALCRDGEDRIDGLRVAADHAARGPSPLVRAGVLLDLGVALRRDRRRADARLPLQQALDLAGRAGATRLVVEATRELDATGARRRAGPAWGLDALTPREHELARLAAQGLSNTEIAERLFITRKTVEAHLSTIYRKLEIGSRKDLGAIVAAG